METICIEVPDDLHDLIEAESDEADTNVEEIAVRTLERRYRS